MTYSRGRWLIPLVFVGGYLATVRRLEGLSEPYFWLTLISLLSCCLLLTQMDRPLDITLPFWLLLFVFIFAYYFKFYWIVYDPDIIQTVWFPQLHWIAAAPRVLISAYATTTYAFTSFCITSWGLMTISHGTRQLFLADRIRYRHVIWALVGLLSVLMAVSTDLMYTYGIGVMAAEGVYLPFRLAGVVFYTRFVVIPGLILLLIWSGEESGLGEGVAFGLLLLMIHGMSETVLKGSKAGLLWLLVQLGMLWVLTNRLTKRRGTWSLILIGMNLALFPAIQAYRLGRTSDADLSINYGMSQALGSMLQGSGQMSGMLEAALKMTAFRFTGMDLLLPILGSGVQKLGLGYFFDPYVGRVMTTDVYGYSEHAIQGIAPGVVGWFYLVGGNLLVVIGIVCLLISQWLFWRALSRLRLRALPVAQVLCAFIIFGFWMDGAFDYFLRTVGALITAICVCEGVMRLFGENAVIGGGLPQDAGDA
jgi:hypothetical protein